ncbi:MAG: hypothetical protein MUC54_06880 [Chloroflexi bacterium]|jgi:hypothetical protein|nr:hypothetical protein [Chloroflexota bacterium]
MSLCCSASAVVAPATPGGTWWSGCGLRANGRHIKGRRPMGIIGTLLVIILIIIILRALF